MRRLVSDQGLKARLIRSSGWTAVGFGAAQVLRLGSNLILTRLLFPEAFGLMALVTVFMVGLSMLSDVSIGPAIHQNARGDDPDFLDTAWTVQVARGLVLCLMSVALGPVAATLYGEPILVWIMPVAGLSMAIAGFTPTSAETAVRHLRVGQLTRLDLLAQALGLVILVTLAWAMRSVWALAIGMVISAALRLWILKLFLRGRPNRFRWDPTAAHELLHFGKWIFLSTVCGFVLLQGDRAILGKYLTLDVLGIYNIGAFLGGVALSLIVSVQRRTMLPLHRERPPQASDENYARMRQMRLTMNLAGLAGQAVLALGGVWLVDVLYDPRFALAGGVVVAVACMGLPYLLGMSYDFAALAAGDSRGFFLLLLVKTIVQTALFLAGAQFGGLGLALAGIWLSHVVTYPLVIRLARRHGAWDPVHDAVIGCGGLLVTAGAFALHRDTLMALIGI